MSRFIFTLTLAVVAAVAAVAPGNASAAPSGEAACQTVASGAVVCRVLTPEYRVRFVVKGSRVGYLGRFPSGAVTRKGRAGLDANRNRARAYRRGAGVTLPQGNAWACRKGDRVGRWVCLNGRRALSLRTWEDASGRATWVR